MRVLVIGRTGQVAQALKASAHSLPDIQLDLLGRPTLDICVRQDVLRHIRAAQPDVVINAAAYTAVDAAETSAEQAFAVNCDGAAAIASAAADLGVPFLHLSTDFVFSGDKDTPYLEEDRPAPINVYGQSKWAGEQAVQDANPGAIIVRLSWVYSRFGRNFARTMLDLAKTRTEISVVEDQRGRPTAAEDIAPALLQMARALIVRPAPDKLYHLASGGDASWAEFVSEIMAISQAEGGPVAQILPIPATQYPTAAKRPAYSVLDCARVAQDFGISLPDWRQTCQDVVRALFGEANMRPN